MLCIDPAFTTEERGLIIAARNEWVKAADSDSAYLKLADECDDSDPYAAKIRMLDPFSPEGQEAEAYYFSIHPEQDHIYLGIWHSEYGNFHLDLVPTEIYADAQRNEVPYWVHFLHTTMHEMGHALGVHHLGVGGLMGSPADPHVDCIDKAAISTYCKSEYCGPNAGSTCP